MDNKSILTVVLLLIILPALFFFLKPTLTGLVTLTEEFNYTDTLNLEINSSSEYIWVPENKATISSVRIAGSYKSSAEAGYARVYIEHDNKRYLIFDSGSGRGASSITGFAVDGASGDVINDTVNETLVDEIVSTNETKANISTNATSDKTISINLEYKTGSVYDPNDNGRENLKGVIDLSVETTIFNWAVDPAKLCTRWQVYSLDNKGSSSICYGSLECCALVELVPEGGNWSDIFYLNYGKYGAGLNNIISAQVIYADYNLSSKKPYSEIVYSSLQNLTADFYYTSLDFEDICIETCSLFNFNAGEYKLAFEINNSVLNISSIAYTLTKEVSLNNAPVLLRNIPNITITKNRNFTFNLSDYFYDEDRDILSYSYYKADNITVVIEGHNAVIIPERNYISTRYMFFRANDSFLQAISNVFKIEIIEGEEEKPTTRVEINKPVKWLKEVLLEQGGSVNITHFASNITVRKIEEGIKTEIPKQKIKVKHQGSLKALEEYETGKKVKKLKIKPEKPKKRKLAAAVALQTTTVQTTASQSPSLETNTTELIIEENVTDIEIEYFTEGPISDERIISEFKKEIIVSSGLHYEDIVAYTSIEPESNADAIKLYRTTGGIREEVSIIKNDTNNNGLIDYIEWIVPSLSNQTYEVEITVLNVQSYPTVGGNWTVRFNTSGSGNLTIFAINGTTFTEIYDNSSTEDDLEFLEVKCNATVLNASVVLEDGTIVPYDVYLKVKRVREIDEVLK